MRSTVAVERETRLAARRGARPPFGHAVGRVPDRAARPVGQPGVKLDAGSGPRPNGTEHRAHPPDDKARPGAIPQAGFVLQVLRRYLAVNVLAAVDDLL